MPEAVATIATEIAIAKSELEKMLDKLPDPMPIEELVHRLLLWKKWKVSEDDIAAGRTYTQEEIEAQAASWGK